MVVAGPGSGKTRVLTERIRRLLNENKGHFRILALTFTNKAANEMKERLSEFPDIDKRAFIGTLHSFCMEVLANRGKSVGIDKLPNIFESYQDRKQILIQAVTNDIYLQLILKNLGHAKRQEELLNQWLNMIGEAKNNLLLPEMLDNEVDKKVYEAYNNNLHASDAVDFYDLLLLTYRLFVERPKIANFYRRQYRYICIDEAQDLNEAQYQVIRALCGLEHRNIMIVGDPKQAIFVWNGADPKYLDKFKRDFLAERISMTENFRSSQSVVNAAKHLDPEYEVKGELPIIGLVELIVGNDERHEAVLVLDQIQALIQKGHKDIEGSINLESCALLGRNRYVLSAAEEELNKRKWPYYKQLSAQHESESELLQDFELCLRILANPRDRLHLGMLYKRWKVEENDYLLFNDKIENGLQFLTPLKKKVSRKNQEVVIQAVETIEWTDNNFKLLKAMDHLNKFAENIESKAECALIMQDIKIWQKHWDSFLRSQPGGQHSLTQFLGQVALGTTQQLRQEGLALLTVHSSKGLEFDVVVVMGMAEGTFPDYRAKDIALQEEDRNAFVAATRSKRLLFFSYPKTKIMPWGDVWKQKPSRYLTKLGLIEGF